MKDEIANKRSTKSRKIGRAISIALELPEDVILGLPRVTLQGDESLLIENHCGILEYSNDKVVVNTSLKPIMITGKRLVIRNIGKDNIGVEGHIRSFEFLDGKEKA